MKKEPAKRRVPRTRSRTTKDLPLTKTHTVMAGSSLSTLLKKSSETGSNITGNIK